MPSTDTMTWWRISIHVPRVGDDGSTGGEAEHTLTFLSTSPAWGTTLAIMGNSGNAAIFLSTSPAWGTTGNTVK